MLLLHVSVTVTNRVIPTVLNVPPTISACSTPAALVDDGFIPNVLDTSFMLHRSLVAGELKSHKEEPIMEVLEVVANP
jgi:hypothetical protein